MKVYSIYDKVSKTFNQPFVSDNDDVAIRSFMYGVKDNPFATDLELYCVGMFIPDSYKQPFVSCDSDFVASFDLEACDNG